MLHMVKATCRVLFVCMTISGVFCNPALAASRPKFTIVIIKSICPKLYCHLPSPLPFMRLLELCSFAGRSPKVFCLASCTNLREKALEHPLFRHLYHISVFSDSLESESCEVQNLESGYDSCSSSELLDSQFFIWTFL